MSRTIRCRLCDLLLYSNELDIEALIASTSTWQKTTIHPETMHALVAAYGQVRSNLLLHAKGWPEAAYLDRRIFSGQTAYGMAATGADNCRDGAKAIIHGERPGGQNRPLVDLAYGAGRILWRRR